MKSILRFLIAVLFLLPGCGLQRETIPYSPYEKWSHGPSPDPTFFPLAVWLQEPDLAGEYKKAGINTYVGLWNGPTRQQLDQLKQAGMRVICQQNEIALRYSDDTLITGWLQDDEPDNAQPLSDGKGYGPPIHPAKVISNYETMREEDSSRPVLLNLGQGVAWDNWHGRGSRTNHPEDYPEYAKGGDIISFDIYPAAHLHEEVAGNLWYVGKGVERLCALKNKDQVVWNCLETTRIGNAEAKITPHQLRAEAWMALIHGSMGLIYFVHEFTPNFNASALLDDPLMLDAVTRLNREISTLAPVLNSPSLDKGHLTQSDNPAMPIAVMMKAHEGAVYLFAAGMRADTAIATFSLEAFPNTAEVTVIGENRKIILSAGNFQDQFMPWDVHLYRIENNMNWFIPLLAAFLFPANTIPATGPSLNNAPGPSFNNAPVPVFKSQVIDGEIAIGYGLAIGDVDGDKMPDILLADKKEIVWYRNGDWKRFVMAKDLTPHDNVCLAARDINGDGLVEVAVGAQWNPGETSDTSQSGAVFYLERPADPTAQWNPVKLYHEPTVHRMGWVLAAPDRYQLLVLPLHGRGNKHGEGEGVRVMAYEPPESENDTWSYKIIDRLLHMTHNFEIVPEKDRELLYVGGKEGVRKLKFEDGQWTASWLMYGPSFGELRAGHDASDQPWLAGIEPMHGNTLSVYPGLDTAKRQVLTKNMNQGHALAAADLTGAGGDQVIAGWRNPNAEGKVGIQLWQQESGEWVPYTIDDDTMACEDLKVADLDGDGRQDIIAAGRATHNLIIYWNHTEQ